MEQMEQNSSGAQRGMRDRNLLVRLLYMLLMAFILQFCGTLLFILAIVQFVIVVIDELPNARLATFGRHLGSYVKQIVEFLTFASEEVPFPFSDWPST
jgi:hypothetical protein